MGEPFPTFNKVNHHFLGLPHDRSLKSQTHSGSTSFSLKLFCSEINECEQSAGNHFSFIHFCFQGHITKAHFLTVAIISVWTTSWLSLWFLLEAVLTAPHQGFLSMMVQILKWLPRKVHWMAILAGWAILYLVLYWFINREPFDGLFVILQITQEVGLEVVIACQGSFLSIISQLCSTTTPELL